MPAISEPTTMLSDYALAIAGWVLAILLPHVRGVNTLTRGFWAIGFIALGFAALLGGTFHGFRLYFGGAALETIWNASMLLIAISGLFMVSGVAISSNSRHDESTKWFIYGGMVTMTGLAIQHSRLSLGPGFNHNDIFHCVQIAALVLLYQGARLLRDRNS
jgi:hypothetical protein